MKLGIFLAVVAVVFGELVERHVKFKLHPDLVDGNAVAAGEKLSFLMSHVNYVFQKTTIVKWVFDASADVDTWNEPFPTGGSCTFLEPDFDTWIFINKSTLAFSHGGTTFCRLFPENAMVVGGMSFARLYSEEEVAALNAVWLEDYFRRQVQHVIHELGHALGVGLGEYYNLGTVRDPTGVAPVFDVSVSADPSGPFWGSRWTVLDDPMFGPPSAFIYLEEQAFNVLSSSIINKAVRGEFCHSLPFCTPPQLSVGDNFVTVSVVDIVGDPLTTCDVTVWAVSLRVAEDYGVVTSGPVNASGMFAFEWGQNPSSPGKLIMNNDNMARLLKVYCDGLPPQAKWLTSFDLQAREQSPAGTAGDFELYAELVVVVGEQVCGNLILEDGEECDGGPCCDPSTCTFRPPSTMCSLASGPCARSATCSGTSAECPDKLFVPRGPSMFCAAASDCICQGFISECKCPSLEGPPNSTSASASTSTSSTSTSSNTGGTAGSATDANMTAFTGATAGSVGSTSSSASTTTGNTTGSTGTQDTGNATTETTATATATATAGSSTVATEASTGSDTVGSANGTTVASSGTVPASTTAATTATEEGTASGTVGTTSTTTAGTGTSSGTVGTTSTTTATEEGTTSGTVGTTSTTTAGTGTSSGTVGTTSTSTATEEGTTSGTASTTAGTGTSSGTVGTTSTTTTAATGTSSGTVGTTSTTTAATGTSSGTVGTTSTTTAGTGTSSGTVGTTSTTTGETSTSSGTDTGITVGSTTTSPSSTTGSTASPPPPRTGPSGPSTSGSSGPSTTWGMTSGRIPPPPAPPPGRAPPPPAPTAITSSSTTSLGTSTTGTVATSTTAATDVGAISAPAGEEDEDSGFFALLAKRYYVVIAAATLTMIALCLAACYCNSRTNKGSDHAGRHVAQDSEDQIPPFPTGGGGRSMLSFEAEDSAHGGNSVPMVAPSGEPYVEEQTGMCPICGQPFPLSALQSHSNHCLDAVHGTGTPACPPPARHSSPSLESSPPAPDAPEEPSPAYEAPPAYFVPAAVAAGSGPLSVPPPSPTPAPSSLPPSKPASTEHESPRAPPAPEPDVVHPSGNASAFSPRIGNTASTALPGAQHNPAPASAEAQGEAQADWSQATSWADTGQSKWPAFADDITTDASAGIRHSDWTAPAASSVSVLDGKGDDWTSTMDAGWGPVPSEDTHPPLQTTPPPSSTTAASAPPPPRAPSPAPPGGQGGESARAGTPVLDLLRAEGADSEPSSELNEMSSTLLRPQSSSNNLSLPAPSPVSHTFGGFDTAFEVPQGFDNIDDPFDLPNDAFDDAFGGDDSEFDLAVPLGSALLDAPTLNAEDDWLDDDDESPAGDDHSGPPSGKDAMTNPLYAK